MAADQRRSGDDRISSLPDELLHEILVRLRCADAAARTSVLSRRWRHVWTHLPDQRRQARSGLSFLDTVDAVLARHKSPAVRHLGISLSGHRDTSRIPTARVAPWLQFAAERVAGELSLHVPLWFLNPRLGDPMLELPVCGRAKRIELSLTNAWCLRPPAAAAAAGVFAALTSLEISSVRMVAAELTDLVCTQCPSLSDLTLYLELMVAGSDISLCSSSLRSLVLGVKNTRRLEVVTPELEELTVYHQPVEADISASKLVMVAWHDTYDPNPKLHRFANVGRCSSLRLLETSQSSAVPFLTKRFHEVDELKLSFSIPQGVAGYGSFLNETNKLPKCKSFRINLTWDHHGLVPSISRLLKRCNITKKIWILLLGSGNRTLKYSCPSSCPCRLEESCKIDGAALSSLEEVQISEFTLENMELVEFLCSNAAMLKRLVINYKIFPAPQITKEVCEKILSMCQTSAKVDFRVFRDAKHPGTLCLSTH